MLKQEQILRQVRERVDTHIWNNVWQPTYNQAKTVRDGAYQFINGINATRTMSASTRSIMQIRNNFNTNQ